MSLILKQSSKEKDVAVLKNLKYGQCFYRLGGENNILMKIDSSTLYEDSVAVCNIYTGTTGEISEGENVFPVNFEITEIKE